MNSFKSQLTGLIETLQQLPNDEQEAAHSLLKSSLLPQLTGKYNPPPPLRVPKINQDHGEIGVHEEQVFNQQDAQDEKKDQEISNKKLVTKTTFFPIRITNEESLEKHSFQDKNNLYLNEISICQNREPEKSFKNLVSCRDFSAPKESLHDLSSHMNINYNKAIHEENEVISLSYNTKSSSSCNKKVDESLEKKDVETVDSIANVNSLEVCTQAVSHLTFSLNIPENHSLLANIEKGNNLLSEICKTDLSINNSINVMSVKGKMNLENKMHVYAKHGRRNVSKSLLKNKLNMFKRNLPYSDRNEIIDTTILPSSTLSFGEKSKNSEKISHVQNDQEISDKDNVQTDKDIEKNTSQLLQGFSWIVREENNCNLKDTLIEKKNFSRSSKIIRDIINKEEIVRETSRLKSNHKRYETHEKNVINFENEVDYISPHSTSQNGTVLKSLKWAESSLNSKEEFPTMNSVHEDSKSSLSTDIKHPISVLSMPMSYTKVVSPLSEKSNQISTFCPVSCRNCTKTLKDVSLLLNHQQRCSRQLICNYCQAEFMHKITYKKHIEGHQRNSCSLCSENFSNQKMLRSHMKQEHNLDPSSKTFHCQFCSRVFLKRSSLYYHLNMHKINSQVVCQKCGFICQNNEEFKQHIEEHIKKTKFSCEICSEFFIRRQQFDDHMKGHQKNKCELCSESYSTKKALIRHYRSLHKTVPKNISIDKEYKCDKCSKVFNRPSLLCHHLQLHTGIKPLECKICNKSFSHGRGLRKHKKSSLHKQMLLTCNLQKDHSYDLHSQHFQEYLCVKCDLKLPNKSRLLYHYNSVHKISNIWSCQHCSYKTSRRNNLSRHIDLHLEKRKFMCEICGSSFNAMATLKDHYRFVHSDERNFNCSLCKKSFKNKSSLVRHQRIHSDKRPYQCHCGLSYKRQSHLKRHVSSAHNELLESRAVKAIKLSENVDYSSASSRLSNTDDFEFIPAPAVVSESNIKQTADIILPTHESIILMSDNSVAEGENLITVSDTPIIQFIPSAFQLSQENGSFQAMPLMSTAEFQTSFSLNSGNQFDSGQVVVEPFMGNEATTVVMVSPPCVVQTSNLSSNSETLESSIANITNTGSIVTTRTGSSIPTRNTSKQITKHFTLNSLRTNEEAISSSIQNLNYTTEGTQAVQSLLSSSIPSSNYHTHTFTSNASMQCQNELLQQNLTLI